MANKYHTTHAKAKEVIDKCDTCYVGMVDPDNLPYVLPFNFGYAEQAIFLHSGPTGKKQDVLKNNPEVCISFSTDHELYQRHEQVACSSGMRYRSVLAFGKAIFIDNYDEKVRIMNIIMQKYAGKDFTYSAPSINNLAVYRVEIHKIETIISGY
jgi:nitroimidazol reductase NimA-like FMN-containing flavoprotein (pyridoxamine 5'-phosphate oxidase superfamily)